MKIEEILDYALPYTKQELCCAIDKQKKDYRREKLRTMIEAYKNGDIVNFDALHISVDVDEILKRINN